MFGFLPKRTTKAIDKTDYPMLPQRTKEKVSLTETERRSVGRAGLCTLQLSCNGSIVQELSLDRPRLIIGRSEDADWSIPSDYVSRHHILLLRHDGSTILIDLNSTNGTFVNSQRVHNHVMVDGDVITVDTHSMFVHYSIKFTDHCTTARTRLGDIHGVNAVIAKALKDVGNLLWKDDTDLLPTLSENVPTRVGFIDDR